METDYDKLKLDVLKKLIEERDIPCKTNKEEIIKYLKLDDDEKYIRETTYEKDGKGFIVGIDLKNQKHIMEMTKLVILKEAQNIHRYNNNRIHYRSNQKLL